MRLDHNIFHYNAYCMKLILRPNHSSLWDSGKHSAVLENIGIEKTRSSGMPTWKLEISHVRQAAVLPSPALRHVVGVFSSLDHGLITLKIWDQDQLFSTGQITKTTNPACFILVAFPPTTYPLVYLLISPRDIVCYYTEEDLVIMSFSAVYF